jgi:hypothetical protein
MTKILLAACAAPALSGCVTAEEMAAQDSEDCHSYGAATGTDAYFQCRMVKSQQRIDASERGKRSSRTASTLSPQTTPRASDAEHSCCADLLTGTSEVHEPCFCIGARPAGDPPRAQTQPMKLTAIALIAAVLALAAPAQAWMLNRCESG